MKNYSVAPNKDATAWFVKIEDVALEDQYDKMDKAIEAGKNIAQENKPSTLTIMNKYHEVEDKQTFND